MIYKREFYANILVIETYEFDVILEIDWLNTFHVVIDCRKGSIVIRILNIPDFEFIGGNSCLGLIQYRVYLIEGVQAIL